MSAVLWFVGGLFGGAIGLIALAWFTRDIFPTIFLPSDWD
jgi:hypothetical protein